MGVRRQSARPRHVSFVCFAHWWDSVSIALLSAFRSCPSGARRALLAVRWRATWEVISTDVRKHVVGDTDEH